MLRIPKRTLSKNCQRLYSVSAVPTNNNKTVETIPLISDPNYHIPNNSTIFSGIQPTGMFHLGNYFGATRNWSDLSEKIKNENINSKLLFFIADLHSLTVPQDYKQLQEQRLEAFASLIACGIDPEQATVFYQSQIPEHSQLQWILSCFTGIGILNRMTQWKSKANLKSNATIEGSGELGKVKLGLFAYPVLMASDVLLYNATHVPVGLDQSQHLELTREIAEAFNKQTKSGFFNIPKTLLAPSKKILSLKNPAKKMSKSDPDVNSKIFITESPKEIRKKINKTVTDSIEGKITFDPINRPGISNLLTILSAVERCRIEELIPKVENFSKKELKELVAESLIKDLSVPSSKYAELIKNREYLDKLSKQGTEKAREIASKNLKEVMKLVGMA
ncbi:unnamed protein product [Ambrosiozyma monospora]|uniref:Unnamed protein product n=1 Tax=Ambrosiozyma monospora TaxID=43982 RepID=A0ACB5SZU9_AMBMO|nr:unnamed protein product [Ambrosiozyma monospora]